MPVSFQWLLDRLRERIGLSVADAYGHSQEYPVQQSAHTFPWGLATTIVV